MTRKEQHVMEAGAEVASRLVRNRNYRNITGNWRHPAFMAGQVRRELGVSAAVAAAVAIALARR